MIPPPIQLDDDDQAAIADALECIEGGGVIVFPTDTVYGLLAGIYHPDAYQRIYELKRRGTDKPIALLAGHNSVLATNIVRVLGMHLPELAQFQAGAVTIVIDPAELPPGSVPQAVRDTQPGSVGVRIPAHDALQQLLEEAGGLAWATSVNAAGAPPAVTSDEVIAAVEELDGDIDCLVVSHSYSRGTPSRILRLAQGLITELPR